MIHVSTVMAFTLGVVSAPVVSAQDTPRITVIADAFSERDDVELDWGFAALIEYRGQRILFDAGNDGDLLATNAGRLGIDLTRLDMVVISHRHGDHANGLRHVLAVNPEVPIYSPSDEYFGTTTPAAYFERARPELPARMRYFGGHVPATVSRESAWPVQFHRVAAELEVSPGIRLVANRDPDGPYRQTPELSLVLDTPSGQIIVAGCSHPGIERILASVEARNKPVAGIVGGLHLVTTPDSEIDRLVQALRTEWNVQAIAPGHCSGEYAFAAVRRAYGPRYHYAGRRLDRAVRAVDAVAALLLSVGRNDPSRGTPRGTITYCSDAGCRSGVWCGGEPVAGSVDSSMTCPCACRPGRRL